MKIEKNIIKIQEEKKESILIDKDKMLDFCKVLSKEERLQEYIKTLKGRELGEYEELFRVFFDKCFDTGVNQSYLRLIPKVVVNEDKIKVNILLWNGKAEDSEREIMPLKIYKDKKPVMNVFIKGNIQVKSGEICVFQHIMDNSLNLSSDDQLELNI